MTTTALLAALRKKHERLVRAAEKRNNCPHCQPNVRRWDEEADGPKPPAEDLQVEVCEHCGSEYWVILRMSSVELREFKRIEACLNDDELFTTRQGYAYVLWREPWRGWRECLASPEDPENYRTSIPGSRIENEGDSAGDYIKVKLSPWQLTCRRLAARYGEDPFPDLTQRVEELLSAPHPEHGDPSIHAWCGYAMRETAKLETFERAYLVRAEMERAMLGRACPETERDLKRVIDEMKPFVREGLQRAEYRRLAQ